MFIHRRLGNTLNSATQVKTELTLTLTSLLRALLPDGSFTVRKMALDKVVVSELSSVCGTIVVESILELGNAFQ